MVDICETHGRIRCGECRYIDELKDRIAELEAEVERLKAANIDCSRELSNAYLMISQYKEVDKVIEWIKEKFEEEWTYEAVEEIIQKLEYAVGGESNESQNIS